MPFIRSFTPDPPVSLWQLMPTLKFLLLVVLGIIVGWTVKDGVTSYAWWIITAALTAASITLYFVRHKNTQSREWKLLPLTLSFTLVTLSAAWLQQRYESIIVHWPTEKRVWISEVNQIIKTDEKRVTLSVTLKNDSAQFHNKEIRLQLSPHAASTLQPGDYIAFAGRIRQAAQANQNPSIFNFNNYLIQHGFSGSCYPSSWQYLKTPSTLSLKNQLLVKRQKLVSTYAHYFNTEDLSIIAALTLGDKTQITPAIRQLFSDTGTSHVLALSGLHLGILVSLFNLLFMRHLRHRWKRLVASLLLLCLLWTFAFLVGAPISLLRSVLMFTLLQIGVCMQRIHTASLNSLSIAALLLLSFDPLTLFDVGFQLSFAAVFFILLTNQYVWLRYRLPTWYNRSDLQATSVHRNPHHSLNQHLRYVLLPQARQGTQRILYQFFKHSFLPFVCISISAQWGTAPLVLYYFHTFAPYAWLANFVVIPAAYLLLGGSLVFWLLPFSPLRQAVAAFLSSVLHGLTTCLSTITQWPFATLHLYPTPFTLLLIIIAPVLIFAFYESTKRKQRKRILLSLFTALAIGIACEVYGPLIRPIRPHINVYKAPHTTLVHFISSARQSYLYTSATPTTTHQHLSYIDRYYFQPNGISYPKIIKDEKVQFNDLGRSGSLFMFAHKRILLLNNAQIACPCSAIDLLIIAHGSTPEQLHWLQKLSIKQAVLDASLTTRQRQMWNDACQAANIPCHDVQQDGAFELKL